MCGGCHGEATAPQYARYSDNVDHPILDKITNTRLDKFFSGPYASQHLDSLLSFRRLDSSDVIKLTYWSAPGDSKPSFDEAIKHLGPDAPELKKGFLFGLSWTNHWVRAEITIPEELRSAEQLIFEWDPSCEALIFSEDGTPLHAITGGPNTMKDGVPGEQEDRRIEHIIPAEAVKAGKYTCIIETTCNSMFGLGPYRYQTPDPNRTFPLVGADLVHPNPVARGLRNDFRILTEVARHPDGRLQGLSQRALKACDDIMNAFVREEGDEEHGSSLSGEGRMVDDMIGRCRGIAWKVLGSLDEDGLQRSCMRNDEKREARIWTMGHCHIDTAWLWRYTQTQQKIARSWSTQCDLIERWPNHQFSASSAQQYLWLEQLYPKAFERVKGHIKSGKFHYVGGAWLEHDCMMPSGESLVRQYLYGQRYFRSRFGEYCREAFLPDTFGYASQLPQILRQAGLNYFLTMKIAWNNVTVFPYTSFNWAGLDGTQVLAHLPSVPNYNSQCTFSEIVGGVKNNKNLGVTDQCLMLFGNGDGGGGPTPTMLEKLDRLSSLSVTNPEVPTMKVGSPIEFFDDLCERTEGGKRLPTWHGELYLELHRGTYTTQAQLKQGNRDMETLLRDLEYFATLASLQDESYQYPKTDLDEMWQDILCAMFHDCIPGTTIRSVVEDNLEIYSKRGKQARGLIAEALTVLQRSDSASLTIIDPLREERDHVYDHDGALKWLKTDMNGIGAFATPTDLTPAKASQHGGESILENARLRVTLTNGRITSLYDKLADRELVGFGPGGISDAGLMLYDDYPLNYDAWDAEIYHLKCGRVIAFEEVEVGLAGSDGLRASLIGRARFGKSSAVVTLSLDATKADSEDGLLRIHIDLDWNEKHRFIKFALPTTLRSPHATYGTQFGVVQRPTHRNTLTDIAKFEACAHGFTDFSEANYGVALIARDKYGYTVEGNTMRISLLRAPTSPDPITDQGKHEITFGVLCHLGAFGAAGVEGAARRFCNGVYVLDHPLKPLPSFNLNVKTPHGIVLETIKRGEDDFAEGYTVDRHEGRAIVLRVYEGIGGAASGTLDLCGLDIARATYVNIMEHDLPGSEGEVSWRKDSVGGGKTVIDLRFRPFEIKTIKLVLA